jgi:hypothetical protein
LPSPDDLRDAFRELRAAEQRHLPPFRLGGAPAPPRRTLRLAFAIAALLIVVVAAALLRRASSAQRPAISSISTWKAPTDFLLQTPNAKLMKTVPTFGVPKRGTSS